jgi:hypothetical protein
VPRPSDCLHECTQRYNISVAAPHPQRESRPPRHHIYALETTGLLLIAIMLLILTLIRYWQNIDWSAH